MEQRPFEVPETIPGTTGNEPPNGEVHSDPLLEPAKVVDPLVCGTDDAVLTHRPHGMVNAANVLETADARPTDGLDHGGGSPPLTLTSSDTTRGSPTENQVPTLPSVLDNERGRTGPDVFIDAVVAPKVSFATHQCDVPVLRELRLMNTRATPLEDVRLEIASDPPVFTRREWRLDRVPAGGEAEVTQRDLQLHAGLLLQLNEAVRCTVTLRATEPDGTVLAERHLPVELLARTEWGGATMPELLAAFVLPNDATVSRMLKSADEALRQAGKPGGMDGYQSGERARSWELASAIWSAVAALRLSYAEPPKSFEQHGQKVRTPTAVVDTGLGTCLDTALLFASVLEQAGLYPVLVLTHGHAFVGVWLQPQEFATLMVGDAASLRKRVALQELVVFETTCATGANPSGFSHAISTGNARIDEAHETEFTFALDVRRARMQRIRPLAFAAAEASTTLVAPAEPGTPAPVEAAPVLPSFDLAEQEDARPSTPEGRLQRWQRKLLDLSPRNRLLNVKPGTNAIALLCPDPSRVEDELAAGKGFRIVAAPSIAGTAGRDAALHAARTGVMLDEAYARQALDRSELLSPNPPDRLDGLLVELYRKAKLDLAEGGANTMFLAIGFLAWRREVKGSRTYRAPLILVPVKLERSSARAGVRLVHREDPPQFNLTLLQMLRQDFEIDIPELGQPLPQDASGIDVARTLAMVRRAVRDAPGFEVSDDMLLGAFSFAKYLMWRDLAERADTLKRNPVVRHLLDTPNAPYVSPALPPKPEALDAEVAPADLFMPLPADSSQVAAVVGSARGCDFVLDGPPGTGKSQTIANMIAHNLALGRTVLFVAEKRAALDVVRRRLDANGLGPFCLELHSNKAVKADVLRQLDTAWTSSRSSPEAEWARLAADLRTCRDGLNRLVAALHHVHPNGKTLFGAIGHVVRDGRQAALHLGWPAGVHHDAAQLEAMREAARRLDLQRLAGLAGRGTALAVVGRTEWSNAWQAELLEAAAALGRTAEIAERARDAWQTTLAKSLRRDSRGMAHLAALANALAGAHGFDVAFAFAPDATRAIEHAQAALPVIEAYQAQAAELSTPLLAATVRDLPLATLDAEWAAANASVFFLAKGRRAAVARKIDPTGAADPARDLPVLHRMQETFGRLKAFEIAASSIPEWVGVDSDVGRLRASLASAAGLRSAMTGAADTPEELAALRASLRGLCTDGNDLLAPDATVGRTGATFVAAKRDFDAAAERFGRLAAQEQPFDAADVLAEAIATATGLQGLAVHLNSWCAWCRARNAARAVGLDALVDAIETDRMPAAGALPAFELAYALWWATHAIDADPAVRDFNLLEHADAIERFRMLDSRFTLLTQAAIRARLAAGIPSKDLASQNAGFDALAYQLKLKQSRKPLRELIADMGPALRTLAPCLLMSPLSIAQYLPPDAAIFDLVIFDEASQITPWDAVGAIARGRQVVVAGDPKQMPPTSFFDRSAVPDGGDGDEAEGVDQESILDECIAARLPQRRLTWHYRSRSESLIAFSNHQYYDAELITFPAPVTRDSAVSLRQVAGAWERGRTRTNPIEAQAIAAEVEARLLDPGFVDEGGTRLTLAVITMNAEQQKLIEDLLDAARSRNPTLEPFFAEGTAEPVIVRNLETVQGDERDVILLGIGYGPETPGDTDMTMNFGPLNREGGWRRLNVAITRARRKTVLFASFPATAIDLTRTSARAVQDLKRFMNYAERGPKTLGDGASTADGGPAVTDAAFEEAVAAALASRGWQVVRQVGVSRFRIDMAVVDPDRPADFLLGIECDGESYHGSATARDRDRVRQDVLTGLGWKLVRLWSIDWWLDTHSALDRIDAALKQTLASSRAAAEHRANCEPTVATIAASDAAAQAPEDLDESQIAASEQSPVLQPGGDYQVARFDDFEGRLDSAKFQDPSYSPVLRDMVIRVVETEAPIRDTVLVDRIARAHGFKRSGRQIRDRVLGLARGMAYLDAEPGGSVFVWPDAAAALRWDRARYPATLDDLRPLEDITLRELAAAVRTCTTEDPLTEAARRFGVRRVTSGARERLTLARQPEGHLAR